MQFKLMNQLPHSFVVVVVITPWRYVLAAVWPARGQGGPTWSSRLQKRCCDRLQVAVQPMEVKVLLLLLLLLLLLSSSSLLPCCTGGGAADGSEGVVVVIFVVVAMLYRWRCSRWR